MRRSQSQSSSSSEKEITVDLKARKTVTFRFKPTMTVKYFKSLIKNKNFFDDDVDIYLADKLLRDGENFGDLGIENRSTLHLYYGIKLNIKIPSAMRTTVVQARAGDTIGSIKSLIQAEEGIEPHKFSLIYQGKLLEEHMTLSSLNVRDESILYLALSQNDEISIFVKSRVSGIIVKLEVKVTFTVGDVKGIAGSMLGIKGGSLFYSGQQLEDSKNLATYNIQERSMLEVSDAKFQIFIRAVSNGRTSCFVVEKDTTVQELKEKIFENLKIPVHLQILIYGGKKLEENSTMASYGIGKESTIEFSLRVMSVMKKS